MASKKFIVREGFTFSAEGKTLAEGETLDLPEETGSACHQLELADAKQRAKAAAAEAEEAARVAAETAAAKTAADEEAARLAEVAAAAASGGDV